jgi:hypothetical protein
MFSPKGLDMNLTKQMAGLLGVAASLGAVAAPPVSADGVMAFPNVHVDVPRTPVEQARAAPRQDGMMAYKDPATGKLTAPTPEQAAALTARTPRAPRAASAGAPATDTVKGAPHGGVSLMLSDRHERYATVRKNADGTLTEACAPEGQLGEHNEK